MSPLRPVDADEPLGDLVPELLFNLVYCSRAAAGVDDAEVDRIVATAQAGNRVRGITGLLVFGGGMFFQWLEGRREQVLELMDLIQADPRHHALVVLDTDEEWRERLFGDWSMERVGPEDVRGVLLDALGATTRPGSAKMLREMLMLLDSGRLGEAGRA